MTKKKYDHGVEVRGDTDPRYQTTEVPNQRSPLFGDKRIVPLPS